MKLAYCMAMGWRASPTWALACLPMGHLRGFGGHRLYPRLKDAVSSTASSNWYVY